MARVNGEIRTACSCHWVSAHVDSDSGPIQIGMGPGSSWHSRDSKRVHFAFAGQTGVPCPSHQDTSDFRFELTSWFARCWGCHRNASDFNLAALSAGERRDSLPHTSIECLASPTGQFIGLVLCTTAFNRRKSPLLDLISSSSMHILSAYIDHAHLRLACVMIVDGRPIPSEAERGE